MQYKLPAYYAGQNPFGDVPSFAWNAIVGGPASIDGFLGLAPGTTVYDNARAWGLTGRFLDTLADVQGQQATLRGYADVVATLGLPTADHFPANFVWWPNVRLLAAEMQFGTPAPYGSSGRYAATFKVVARQVAN